MRTIINPRRRYAVLEKYNFKCCACGRGKEIVALEVDHIIPVSKGGTNDIENLQVLCAECNMGKFNSNFSEPNIRNEEYEEKLNQLKLFIDKHILEGKEWIEIKMLASFSGFLDWFPNNEVKELYYSLKVKNNKKEAKEDSKYIIQRDLMIKGVYEDFIHNQIKLSEWLSRKGLKLAQRTISQRLGKVGGN